MKGFGITLALLRISGAALAIATWPCFINTAIAQDTPSSSDLIFNTNPVEELENNGVPSSVSLPTQHIFTETPQQHQEVLNQESSVESLDHYRDNWQRVEDQLQVSEDSSAEGIDNPGGPPPANETPEQGTLDQLEVPLQ